MKSKEQTLSLAQHFLLAMPHVTSQFIDALIYICDHSEEGAMGVIVNYPLELTVADLLEQMNIERDHKIKCNQPVYYGGPIQCDRGFVLHRPCGKWYASLKLNDDLIMTTSRDILEAMATGEGPQEAVVFLGYLGWEENQLETEVVDNIWLSTPADESILFKVPYQQRRQMAVQALGIELTSLSHDIGHA